MKKLVLKTVVITLIVVILLGVIGVSIISIFSPKTLAKMFDELGNYSLAEFYYEKQYKNTDNIDNLYTLCDMINEEKSPKTAQKYLRILVTDKDFNTICNIKDEELKQEVSTYEYMQGKYAVATFLCSGIDGAITVCNNAVNGKKFTTFNAFHVLICEQGENMTKAELNTLREAVRTCSYINPEDDIALIDGLISNLDK